MIMAKFGHTTSKRFPLFYVLILAFVLVTPMVARAIEPTELEPAKSQAAGRLELEIKWSYEDFVEGHETELEAELSYGLNDNLRLGLNVPLEWKEDDEDGIGDIGAFLEWVANPESDGIVVGGELMLTAPTGEESDSMGGEVQLRFSKAFREKHGLHLTLKGIYESEEENEDLDLHNIIDDDDDEDEFGYMAVVGYTFKPVDSTTLITDIVLGEAPGEDANTNLLELGMKHEFNDTVEIGLGIGAGLDDNSPDYVAHVGIEFRFGGKK